MQTIRLAALFCFGFGASAMAEGTVPADYQGVWAAARDCEANFQNILSNVVDRESAACRVMQIASSGRPESHTSTITLNCGGAQSRESWRQETVGDTDYLVIVRFEQAAGAPSIDLYKRCPEIPLAEIPLTEIPGGPIADTPSEAKIPAPSRGVQAVHRRPHSRTLHVRKRSLQ
jgi:hypothetical protein